MIDSEVYTLNQHFTKDLPGLPLDLPPYLIKELIQYLPMYKKRLPFFGGHPVSLTKQVCEEMFKTLNEVRASPYLVCQKTDGVRYLLIVAKVPAQDWDAFFDDENEQERPQGDGAMRTACYLVSRQGQGRLVAYASNIKVSDKLEPASRELQSGRRFIVEVLDGQLIDEHYRSKPSASCLRFLVFDLIIHLGRNITQLPLRERLHCVEKFLHCNQMLGLPSRRHAVPILLKDFFRLTNRKYNIVEFMLKKYIQEGLLPHANDGLIFNHEEKPYVLGKTNDGYQKWKPAHLNTVDFMMVPNENLQDRLGRRILDLYIAIQDEDLQRYTRQFYTWTVVSEETFQAILSQVSQNIQQQMQGGEEGMQINQFAGALIAECRYETTSTEERNILRKLSKIPTQELKDLVMKQSSDQRRDIEAVSLFGISIPDKGWKIYKTRQDKGLPNNADVAKRIEQSIRDGITSDYIIKKNSELNKLAMNMQ